MTGDLTLDDFDGMALVEIARGCPNRRRFCLTCNFETRRLRRMPAARIVAEIAFAMERGVERLGLLCSGLNYDAEVTEAVADALTGAPASLRVDSTLHTLFLDPRRLAAIERIPWGRMIIGLQSTSPEALRVMARRVDLEAFGTAIEQLATLGTPVVEVILGLPGDTLPGFLETMRYVLDLPGEVEVYRLRLDPGSEFHQKREQLGLEADFEQQGKVVSTPTFSAADLAEAEARLQRLARHASRYRARRLGYDFETIFDAAQRDRQRRRFSGPGTPSH